MTRDKDLVRMELEQLDCHPPRKRVVTRLAQVLAGEEKIVAAVYGVAGFLDMRWNYAVLAVTDRQLVLIVEGGQDLPAHDCYVRRQVWEDGIRVGYHTNNMMTIGPRRRGRARTIMAAADEGTLERFLVVAKKAREYAEAGANSGARPATAPSGPQ